ncbi:leucyl/phenylalanyl-tRNA--protein transferase [Aquimarina rhabdastrellae]
MYILTKTTQFPEVSESHEDGLLAIGGDLSSERLIKAYNSGIFPWYNEGEPIIWYAPDPRMVLFPEELKISKSMKQLIRKQAFTVTINKAFDEVIKACAQIDRVDQDGTWITNEMQDAYNNLHQLGYATSVEVWKEEELVGGLYGIWLKEKGVFCGESMFTKVSNASKYGFIAFVQYLQSQHVQLIDCQIYTDHLASMGAREISRNEFMKFLS